MDVKPIPALLPYSVQPTSQSSEREQGREDARSTKEQMARKNRKNPRLQVETSNKQSPVELEDPQCQVVDSQKVIELLSKVSKIPNSPNPKLFESGSVVKSQDKQKNRRKFDRSY